MLSAGSELGTPREPFPSSSEDLTMRRTQIPRIDESESRSGGELSPPSTAGGAAQWLVRKCVPRAYRKVVYSVFACLVATATVAVFIYKFAQDPSFFGKK